MWLDGALAVGNAFGNNDAGKGLLLDVRIEAFGHGDWEIGIAR
jgi:hypothetical protein